MLRKSLQGGTAGLRLQLAPDPGSSVGAGPVSGLPDQPSALTIPAVVHPYINNDRDKGLAFMRRSAATGDIFLLGSSELEIHVPPHPKCFLPQRAEAPWQVTPSGRGLCPEPGSYPAGSFAGCNHAGQRVVLITSLQWFSSPEISKASQQAVFSELQYYHTLDNPALSRSTKTYIEKHYRVS